MHMKYENKTKKQLIAEIETLKKQITENEDLSDNDFKMSKFQEEENKYRKISELISDFVYTIRVEPDGSQVPEWFTGSLENIIGMEYSDLLKQGGWESIIHPEDLPLVMDRAKKLAKGEIDITEYRIFSKDGDVRWVRDYGYPILNEKSNRVTHIYGATIDITEGKRSELNIIQAKSEWERTFNAVPELIAIIDNQYRIVRVNSSLSSRLGVGPEKCVGQKCYELIHGTDSPPKNCPHARLLKDGNEHFEEINEPRLDGEFIVTTSPLLDKSKKITGCVHVARDITARKLAINALRESEEKYRNVAEQSIEGLILLNTHKAITGL